MTESSLASRALAQSVTVFGWETTAFRTDHHVIISEYLLVFSVLLTLSLLLQHYWTKCWKVTWMPEAGITILLGVAVSFLIYTSGGYETLHNTSRRAAEQDAETMDEEAGLSSGLQILCFSPTIFFFGFLPPIIYNSGYHLKRTSFYGNIGAILLLAVGGTCISTMTIAAGMYYAPRIFNGAMQPSGADATSQSMLAPELSLLHASLASQSLSGDMGAAWTDPLMLGQQVQMPDSWHTLSSNGGTHGGASGFTAGPARRYLRSRAVPTAPWTAAAIGHGPVLPQFAASGATTRASASASASASSHGDSQQHLVVPEFTLMECVAYGALISSTDPVSTLAIFTEHRVDPALFYLVFGESVLNDAIAITIYKVATSFIGTGTMQAMDVATFAGKFCIIFLSSCLIGYGLGILSAYLFKVLAHLHRDDLAILGVFCSTVYVPFLLAEMLQLSGIVTILFTGIASRRYTSKNVTPSLRLTISKLFHLLAYVSDTSCFLLLGLITFNLPFASYNWTLIGWLCVLCVGSRCLFVYPLLTLCNVYRRCSREGAGGSSHSSGLPPGDQAGLEMVTRRAVVRMSGMAPPGGYHCCPNPLQPAHDMVPGISHECSYAYCDSSNSTGDSGTGTPQVDIELQEPSSSDVRDYYGQPLNSQATSRTQDEAQASTGEEDGALQQPKQSSLHLEVPLSAEYRASLPPPPVAARAKTTTIDVIPSNIKHMVAFSGLRGGVAFAFAMMFSDVYGNRNVLLTSTISIIMLTIFVQGGLTFQMLRLLGIRTGVTNKPAAAASVKAAPGEINYEGAAAHSVMGDFEQRYIYPLVLVRYANANPDSTAMSHGGGDARAAAGEQWQPARTTGQQPLPVPGDMYSPYYRSEAGFRQDDTAAVLPLLIDTAAEPLEPTARNTFLSPLHPNHLLQQQIYTQQSNRNRADQGPGSAAIHSNSHSHSQPPRSSLCSRGGDSRRMFLEEPCSSGGGSYHDPEEGPPTDEDSRLLRAPPSDPAALPDTGGPGRNRMSLFFSPQRATKYNGLA